MQNELIIFDKSFKINDLRFYGHFSFKTWYNS